jgi:hypothetical protein
VFGVEESRTLAFKTTEAREVRLYERALGDDLRAVHIVRNPIEQFRSTKRTVMERPEFLFFFPPGTHVLPTFVRRWRDHALHAVDRVQREPERNLLVRYEDLRRDPEAEVARILDWLGARATASPDVQTVFDGRRMAQLPTNTSKRGVETPEHVVADTAREFGYAEVMTPTERRLVAAATARLATRLGYTDESGRPRTALRALFTG